MTRGIEISGLTVRQLLALHAQISDELVERRITRSYNNPTGDLAETLFCRAFGWEQAGKSFAHVDAIDPKTGTRYQIKGRRITPVKSRQLGALRDLLDGHFDFLAGVLFGPDYTVMRAAIIPCAVAIKAAKFVKRTNSHRFLLEDDVWNMPGVLDVTAELRGVDLDSPPVVERL
jgi:hypothetical protein